MREWKAYTISPARSAHGGHPMTDHYNGLIDYLYSKLDEDLTKQAVNSMIGCFKPSIKENGKSLANTRSANEAYN